jgi:hypothetical protein
VNLDSSISELRKDNELLDRKVEEQQGLRSSRQKKLDSLISENAEKEKSVAGLEDKVGVYDKLLLHTQDGQKGLAELLLSKERVSKHIEDLMAENTRLDGEVRLLEGKIKAMMHLAGSENLEDADV